MTRVVAVAGGAFAGVGVFNVVAWTAAISPWLGVLALVLIVGLAMIGARR